MRRQGFDGVHVVSIKSAGTGIGHDKWEKIALNLPEEAAHPLTLKS